MKSLDDVMEDMSRLYDQFIAGAIERDSADTAANIAGKNLKAAQIKLAREMFEAEYPRRQFALQQAQKALEQAREPAKVE